jgi:hypothetical protein
MSNPEKVVKLVTSKSDAENAAEIRERVLKSLEPVCTEIDKAGELGFTINFTIGPSGVDCKIVVNSLTISKHY